MEEETRLLPEMSNEELLAELARMEKGTIRVFAGFTAGMMAGPIVGVMLATTQSTLAACCGFGLGALGAVPAAVWARRRERRLESIFAALAERRETRAMPRLLRMQYYLLAKPSRAYRESRTRRAIAFLLPYLSLDEFQALRSDYLGAVISLAHEANPDLRRPTLDALARVGDARALRMLTSPIYRPIQATTAQVKAEVADCVATMATRLEEEQRLAMLLRPSAAEEVSVAPETLLRAASPDDSHTPAEELVRAASVVAHNADSASNTCHLQTQDEGNNAIIEEANFEQTAWPGRLSETPGIPSWQASPTQSDIELPLRNALKK